MGIDRNAMAEGGNESNLSDDELKRFEAMRKSLEEERDRLQSLIRRNEREIRRVQRERELLRIQREREYGRYGSDSDNDNEENARHRTTLTRRPPNRRRTRRDLKPIGKTFHMSRSRCTTCGEEKSRADFAFSDVATNTMHPSGFNMQCMSCQSPPVADDFLVHYIDDDDDDDELMDIADDNDYKLLTHRYVNDTIEYLVEWADGNRTWESVENLSTLSVNFYWDNPTPQT
jgi:hypothetical protein